MRACDTVNMYRKTHIRLFETYLLYRSENFEEKKMQFDPHPLQLGTKE